MKILLPLIIFFTFINAALSAQDIPLFTQKLTNSFLYNPAVAGKTLGSITFSHRQYWSGLEGSPSTNFLSFHTPFAKHRFGFGANLYQEKIGVAETFYGSGAFAYHIRFSDYNSLSMGASVEYNNFKINSSKLDVIDQDDNTLQQSNATNNQIDFSFGMSYQSKYFKLGASANRLSGLAGLRDSTNQFPQYYSAFLNFTLPLANERDLLEPIINYRSLAPGSHQLDVGMYYTYDNKFTLGAGYRTGSIINATAAIKINNTLTLGYSRDIYSGAFGKNIGSSNEFTLRIDFKDQAFYSKSKNARKINTQSLAIRRKTLSTYNGRGTALQKSKRYKNKIKNHYLQSPNYRMNNSTKLQTVKVRRRSR